MNLDKITVNVRPLAAYQAIDLGLMMARHWYGELLQVWLSASKNWLWLWGVLTAFMAGANTRDELWWLCLPVVLGIWWVKPSIERRLLIYISQKLFDEHFDASQIKQLHREFPETYSLTLWRFRSNRMMLMPIYLLEGQSGRSAKERLRLLSRHQDSAITMHALSFFVVEVAVWLVIYFTLIWCFQVGSGFGVGDVDIPQSILMVLMVSTYVMVSAMLMPFYVASGFAIYLCKRSSLEGWDIEITFRKLLARYHLSRQKGGE